MVCKAKHLYVSDSWECPRCGSSEDFYNDGGDPKSEKNCEELHAGDYVYCGMCNTNWTGRQVSHRMRENDSAVICPTCAGRGYVSHMEVENERVGKNKR